MMDVAELVDWWAVAAALSLDSGRPLFRGIIAGHDAGKVQSAARDIYTALDIPLERGATADAVVALRDVLRTLEGDLRAWLTETVEIVGSASESSGTLWQWSILFWTFGYGRDDGRHIANLPTDARLVEDWLAATRSNIPRDQWSGARRRAEKLQLSAWDRHVLRDSPHPVEPLDLLQNLALARGALSIWRIVAQTYRRTGVEAVVSWGSAQATLSGMSTERLDAPPRELLNLGD